MNQTLSAQNAQNLHISTNTLQKGCSHFYEQPFYRSIPFPLKNLLISLTCLSDILPMLYPYPQ